MGLELKLFLLNESCQLKSAPKLLIYSGGIIFPVWKLWFTDGSTFTAHSTI